ncbi:hypothetical protein M0802_001820 [Mischocyttarus mexicanus]|nr:hypothetical protein M0802_001820 [Mischocyttarus mexicanus]
MSQISRQRRFKRVAVLTKKSHYLGRYIRNKACIAAYENLRSNNSSLAKALSKQKQKKQMLFSENVALLAEIQDLSSACIKRDNTIVKVLQSAKEMLKMLVSLTKFVTSTIASCQEFTSSSNTNVRFSCNPISRENRRLSTKTPTKGIVKPMVSGHTITKPTINLSRVNIQHFNNSTNLSTIEEVSSPVVISPLNSNANEDSSPVSVSLRRRERKVDGRICRMPERLNITSPRSSDGDKRRLSKRKSRHSGQQSKRHSKSKSNELSESMNGECSDLMTSVRVTLNDVSNWLQNSPTINIQRLSSMKYNVANDSIEMNDSTNNVSNQRNKNVIIISKKQLSTDFSEENSNNTINSNRKRLENEQPELNVQRNSKGSRNNKSDETDPLEGPSWLLDSYNSNSSLTNTKVENSNEINDFNNKSDDTIKTCTADTSTIHTIQYVSDSDSNSDIYNDEESNKESNNFIWKKSTFQSRTPEKKNVLNYFQEEDIKVEEHDNVNREGFVTRQRGSSLEAIDENMDDFTLMHRRRKVNNMSFDINDLQLPALEDSFVKSIVKKESEPEITTTLTNLPENSEIPLIFNDICNNDDSLEDRITVKLPLLSNTAIDCSIPVIDTSLDVDRRTHLQKTNQSLNIDDHFESITSRRATKRKEKKSVNDKDPSTAKVVLQKLPRNKDFPVKSQIFPLEETLSQNSSILSQKILHSPSLGNDNSDSDSSSWSINLNADSPKRPKRQKAPQNLREPNLRK